MITTGRISAMRIAPRLNMEAPFSDSSNRQVGSNDRLLERSEMPGPGRSEPCAHVGFPAMTASAPLQTVDMPAAKSARPLSAGSTTPGR